MDDKAVMINSRERLKKLIDKRVHHKNDRDKIPAITSDGIYTYLEWRYDLKEENRVVAECNQLCKESYFREQRLHEEWEHKYNQLLKNFQRYIDEHGDNQHQCNCCNKQEDDNR